MAHGYEIRAHAILGGRVLVLAKEGRKDFLEELGADPKNSERFELICRTYEKIAQRGVSRCVGRQNFIRSLEGNIGLVEVKVGNTRIRVMSYLHGSGTGQELVLMFDFTGHQGSGKIEKSDMAKGKKLASIARECMEEE